MNILSADSISKAFSERWLFKNITFGISAGEKVALVGANGSGKTTLMNILAGLIPTDEGVVSSRKGITIGYLPQQPVFDENATIWQAIFTAENEAVAAIKSYETALKTNNNKLLEKAMEDMERLNAWDYEAKIKQVLGRLGIPDEETPVKVLSGGQRKRVALAKLLLQEADLLILDEPTNHLDIEAIEWLEGWLNTQKQSLLLVTHDRYFLDNITNTILELEGGQIFKYTGNYSYFLEKKEERVQQLTVEVDKAKNLMKKELDWIRRQPKARGTKAKYRVEAFEDIKEKASTKVGAAPAIEINVGMNRMGKKILEIEDLNKNYDDLVLIKDFTYTFKKGDRIGIVGKNGVGKTTFLNILVGKEQIDSGKIGVGENTSFGYFTQTDLVVDENKRVIEVIKDIAEVLQTGTGETISASQLLTLFNFPPKTQYDVVSKLSGGERKRLQLLQILIKNPNFLILDEPTNDLDIQTLNVLEDFLSNFGGCLLIVSHDRYFMDRLVENIFIFEGEGKIRNFSGNYSDYRDAKEDDEMMKIEEAKSKNEKVVPATQPQKNEVRPNEAKRKISFKEKKEYETLEMEISKLEDEKVAVISQLDSGRGTHTELMQWSGRIGELEAMIEAKTFRWLELADLM
ncbi:MAG: ABC transporter ATP-binding protein [Cytophagales bacterium]|nr:MAG: ABC transporter ATP-binding protein [Cytophagales bacterium]